MSVRDITEAYRNVREFSDMFDKMPVGTQVKFIKPYTVSGILDGRKITLNIPEGFKALIARAREPLPKGHIAVTVETDGGPVLINVPKKIIKNVEWYI